MSGEMVGPIPKEWYRRYLQPLRLEPLPMVSAGLTSPLARLFLLLYCSVLGPKWTWKDRPPPLIKEPLRCRSCHSTVTRMKTPRFFPERRGLITGFAMRCRVCGAENVITTDVLIELAGSTDAADPWVADVVEAG